MTDLGLIKFLFCYLIVNTLRYASEEEVKNKCKPERVVAHNGSKR